MWLSSGRRAPAIWRQAGEAYVAATVAPRDHHRRAVSRGKHVRGAAGFAASGTTTISCTPGNAVADGITATITNGNAVTISCTPGNAVADGVTAAVQASVTISCTPGNAVADGVAATVTAAVSQLDLILKILRNRQELNPATGKFTLYDDDGTTILKQSNAWADVAGTRPYSGGTLARIDALI